jgi:hypothetical protein
MKKSKLRELIHQYITETIKEEECNCGEDECTCKEVDEITSTGNADGYSTPSAFKKTNGKKKRNAGFAKGHKKPNVFGYSVVKEELDKKDLDVIRKLIKDVISDVYRDIWLKRSVWK